jgi:molybdopterin synthase catalytic subunit
MTDPTDRADPRDDALPGRPALVARLDEQPVDVGALVAQVRRDDGGAIVCFEGTTRSPNHGHEVIALEYEAWPERTPAQLERLAADVADRHGLLGAAVVHRTGWVPVGATAVVVVAVAAHRGPAFAGASELIDRVKSEAWIWKKEHRVGGAVWVEGC